jgi:N-acetylmuramoyl-L-alanine amidase
LLGVLAATAGASTHAAKAPAAVSAWEQAQRARAVFEAAGGHTRAGYARVLDGFRAIYHDNPRDAHAAAAVNAVAELLAEQGRELGDEKSLRAAVGQYEFLRTQYPGSSLREQALKAEAGIERELKRQGLGRTAEVVAGPTHHDEAVMNGARGVGGEANATATTKADSSAALRNDKQEGLRNDKKEGLRNDKQLQPRNDKQDKKLAAVTGIRHWSTASYTRVAIDLGDEVKFEAARVPHPDRIYFDLHGARLAQELVGKSFDVTDDGFLKRIRAAQETGDVTRVVLDVNDVTEYSAFLLPNPERLIIDIHGKRDQGAGSRDQSAVAEVPAAVTTAAASAAADVSGLPAMAPTDGGEMVRPVEPETHLSRDEAAPKVGHSMTVPVGHKMTFQVAKSQMATEVAAVSQAPDRVQATSAPTSRPIAVRSASTHLSRDEAAPKVGHNPSESPGPAKAAEKTADGETSLVRALGLKINRIAIDAGHGGHDSGTLGVDGIQEKDVVLDVALRLGKLLQERLGAEIIYTRSDDTFIPLETRTAIANKAQADLFLSIHANSSPDAAARGVETYYLNFTSDATALDVAARENAVSGASVHQLSDLVKKIALKDKIAESREFAGDVEGSLFAGLTKGNSGLRDRGVKKAPFVVLIGANMPSILAEISFVTNARDAEELRQPEYRQRVAESLYAGVAKYESGLAGVKAAAPVKRAALE